MLRLLPLLGLGALALATVAAALHQSAGQPRPTRTPGRLPNRGTRPRWVGATGYHVQFSVN